MPLMQWIANSPFTETLVRSDDVVLARIDLDQFGQWQVSSPSQTLALYDRLTARSIAEISVAMQATAP
jgi:hypothetical protein